MKRYLPFIIVTVVGMITVATGTMLYRAKRPTVLRMSENTAGGKGAEGHAHVRGPDDASVTLEEFGDFQCPPCGMLAGPIKELEKEHGKDLRIIFHNFPLVTHQHAQAAACSAEAAGLQGKFWEMHDLLYREQIVWSKAEDAQSLFNAYAGILGLDVERFKKDATSEKVKEMVSADQKHGTSIGVQNTPTLFLNNKAVDPANLNPQKLRETVDAAIKAATHGKKSSG